MGFLILFSAPCHQRIVGYETSSDVNETEIYILLISHVVCCRMQSLTKGKHG